MRRDEHEQNEEKFEEPAWEDFLAEEPVTEKDEKRRERKKSLIKFISFLAASALLINVLSIWVQQFNIPSIEFMKKSFSLYQNEHVQEYKKAVAVVEGNGKKGTGFNIDPAGMVITNYHVIEGMNNNINITFPDGKLYRGKVIDQSAEYDIAIINIDGEQLPYLTLHDGGGKSVPSQHVYIIGNPLAHTFIANEGKFIKNIMTNKPEPVMLIDAPVYRGNSGSPVITQQGEVIGVIFATTVTALDEEERTFGLAIPIEQVLSRVSIKMKR